MASIQGPAEGGSATTCQTSRADVSGFASRLFREARAVVQEVVGQMVRLARYGKALWQRRTLRRAATRAELALGLQLFEAGHGDDSLRQQLGTLDDQIRSDTAAHRSTATLQKERQRLLEQLGAGAPSLSPAPPGIEDALLQAREARAAVQRQEAVLAEQRDRLAPPDRLAWRRVLVGHATVVAGLVLAGITLSALSKAPPPLSPNRSSGSETSSVRESPQPPLALAEFDDAEATDPGGVTRRAKVARIPEPRKPAIRGGAVGQPVDLKEVMNRAGFSGNPNYVSIERYVRFGTAERATKLLRGDQFTRLEHEKEVQQHQAEVLRRSYLLREQPIHIPRRDDFGDKGLFVMCRVGFRLECSERRDEVLSPPLAGVHVSFARTNEWWFLTRDDTLLRCNSPAEASLVQKNGGSLYHPESRTSELILILDVSLDTAKTIARNPKDYRVDLVVDELEYRQAFEWGYFLRSELIEQDWDCDRLVHANAAGGLFEKVPSYFRVEMKNLPWLVAARLVSATLKDNAGRAVATYRAP